MPTFKGDLICTIAAGSKITGTVTSTGIITGGTITSAVIAGTVNGVYSPVVYSTMMAVSGSATNITCTGLTTVTGAVVTVKDATGGVTMPFATWTIGSAANKISIYLWKATSTVDATWIASATANVAVLAFGT